jgi:hypothetical protein
MNKIAIILISVILLLVYGILAMDYIKQGPEQERLLSEIEEVDQSRETLLEPSTDAYERLVALEAAIAAEYVVIPAEISSSNVIDTIFSLAQEIGVKAVPLITQQWSEEHIGENTYCVFRIDVEIEGLLSQVRDYVSRLESGEFNTLIVERLIINVDYGEDEEVYAGGATPVEAMLDLAIFTKP